MNNPPSSNFDKFLQQDKTLKDFVLNNDVLISFGKNVRARLEYSSEYSSQTEITYYIVKLTSKFDRKKLLDLDTALEISLALLIHPSPNVVLEELSKLRPAADINTIFYLSGVAQIIAGEVGLWGLLGLKNNLDKIREAFETTGIYQKIRAENISDDVIQQTIAEYFQALKTPDFREQTYIKEHKEIISISADLFLAKMCVSAYLNSDERVINEFMNVRQLLLDDLPIDNPPATIITNKNESTIFILNDISNPDIPNLTPEYLVNIIAPYLSAVIELQHLIDTIKKRELSLVSIKEIKRNSPISVSLDGAGEAIQLIKDTVVPWRRKHAETMARLLEQEKSVEIEAKKAEVIDKKIVAREQANKLKLENEKLRLELQQAKMQLAVEMLNSLSHNMTQAEREAIIQKLLPILDTVSLGKLEMASVK